MKKLCSFFSAIILICAVGKAQYVNIPDSNFRNFLQYRYPACFNGLGQMDTTCTTITGEYSLALEGFYHSLRITDITGIKYFKNLRHFKFYWDDYITTITELPGALESLEVSGLYLLTSLPALPNRLKSFVLNGNASLATSPALPNSLEQLTITAMHGNDGIHFIAVATVNAKGQAANNYNTTVANAGTGTIYYRLKIIDRDGSYQYAPTIKIDWRKNSTGFSVLTNPVKDFIIINTRDKNLDNAACSIINTQGAIVKSFIIHQGSQTIDVGGLPKGMYYLRTNGGSSKVLIQ